MAMIMLPNLSPSSNLYKVQSVYNNNVASRSLREKLRVFSMCHNKHRTFVNKW